MNGCKQCPAYNKCDVRICGYRGSMCAALRFTCGLDSDPENENLRVVERGKKALRGGEVMKKITYKCEACGGIFEVDFSEREDLKSSVIIPYGKHTHACKDGSIGYADFVGFRKEEQ